MKLFPLILIVLGIALGGVTLPDSAVGAEACLKFAAGENNEFVFDTGMLRGKLRAGGKSAGLSSVVHVPSGLRLDASMGLFSHYRLFSSNRRYGPAAWDFPSQARLAEDGSIEVRWPAAADRPFELGAVYRWAAPNVLDLETSVHAQTNLSKFESFLASYFSSSFTNAAVCAGESGERRFMTADRAAGVWLAFPRDDNATAIIQDGRWKYEPNPVDWVLMPRLGCNLGFRRSPASGLTAVILSPREDCFAILTPYQTEPHYSMYLCLFGRDVAAGQTARARARLVLAGNPTEADMLKLHRDIQRPY